MTINELREKRNQAWEAAKAFVEAKKDKDGLLSDADRQTYAQMEQKVKDYGAEIERMERQEAMDRQLNAPTSTPITGKPATAKVETKSQRLQRVRSQHPRAEIRICSVDTDNCFSINDRYYCIAESVYQYAPRETKEGLLYDMDRIHAVLENGIPVLFLDQDGYEMNGQDVYLLE